MTKTRIALLGMALALAGPIRATAQGTPPAAPAPKAMKAANRKVKETQADLAKEAKISLADATATALKEVPGGKVTENELEREKGKLVYSFDIKVAGKEGIEEVAVDAVTGAVVEKSHESAADEAKEAANEGKKPAAKKSPVKKP
jgi:hypothetical protein